MRKTIAALTACCAFGGAAVAQAKPVHYSGQTRAGDPISFIVKKGKISHLKAYVPAVCGTTSGGPLSGTSAFDPSASFRIGHKKTVHGKRDNQLGSTSQITKYFTVNSHRHKRGRISGSLNSSFSFLQVLYTYPISSKSYVCRGDTTFNLHPQG